MYEYRKFFNIQIYIHRRLYSEMGRLHSKKDSGKQYVVAELVSHKFCGNLFHILQNDSQ